LSSVVDIVNIALSHLGEDATVSSIDPPEGSAEAERAAMFYPQARDSLLEMHEWRFATKRVLLALTVSDTFEWSFAYAPPSNMLRALAVLPETSSAEDDGEDYDQQLDANDAQIILTNCEDASLKYTARVTDATRFPPLFIEALSWLLAAHMAGPIIKGDAGRKVAGSCLQTAMGFLAQAKVSDANQRKVEPTHTPGWIGGR
jgi:hypothetical protein